MAARVLSPRDYVTYLNNYIHRLLNKTDRFLVECIDETYFDEIEECARSILARWLSEQMIDPVTSIFIGDVGVLNNRLASLKVTLQLNQNQIERIQSLIWNPKSLSLYQAVLQLLLDSTTRHDDDFLNYLTMYFDPLLGMKSDCSLKQLCSKLLRSNFYQHYLNEIMSSNIQPKHRFFLGTISQLAPLENSLSLNELYIQYLMTFYDQMTISNNRDLHYCTRGILFQLDINTCMNNEACLSALLSIFYYASKHSKDYAGVCLLRPIFQLFINFCLRSKTIGCYLNSDQFIHVLLQHVPQYDDNRFDIDACILLGHVVSEQQLIDLRITYRLTMKLIDLLSYSHHDKNGILASLHSLAIHRSVQTVIAQSYQLTTLIHWTGKYSIVYDLIWTLSFHSEILLQLIHRHESFLKTLEVLENNIAAQGIRANIEMRTRSRIPYEQESNCDLHLVYSPKDRLIIEQIEQTLSDQGIRMGALNDSACVLLCISEESKNDSSCQTTIREALLDCRKLVYCVVRQPYRLDDWFESLQIQEKSLFNIVQSKLDDILPELRKAIRLTQEKRQRTRIITPSKQSSQLSSSSSVDIVLVPSPRLLNRLPTQKIQSWTKDDVQQWCKRENLTGFTKILALYDGRSLLGLAHVSRNNTPQTIINQLRNDCRKFGLKLSFVDFVRFQTALDQLLRLEKLLERKTSISTLATRYVYQNKNKGKK